MQRLILDGDRCRGVEWESGGELHSAEAELEVIVSAGTIQSPQVLMLSGIGPAEHLSAVGVEPLVDLPGVGENLHDHLLSPVIFSAERTSTRPLRAPRPRRPTSGGAAGPGLAGPDMQPIHFAFPMYEEWMEGPENGFTFQAGMIRPLSRGSIRLSGPTLGRRAGDRPAHPQRRARPAHARGGRRAVPRDRQRAGTARGVEHHRALPRPRRALA